MMEDFESRIEAQRKPITGVKFDKDKPDWSLLPLDVMEEVVQVLTLGNTKYSRDNWKHLGDAENRHFAAMMRHVSTWQSGDKLDKETGLSHLSHAMCNLIFLLWGEQNESRIA